MVSRRWVRWLDQVLQTRGQEFIRSHWRRPQDVSEPSTLLPESGWTTKTPDNDASISNIIRW